MQTSVQDRKRPSDFAKEVEIREHTAPSWADLDLLRRHCPVAWLHRKERLRPCSVDHYVSQCSLHSDDGTDLLLSISPDGREIIELAEANGEPVSGVTLRYNGPGLLKRLGDSAIEDVPFYGNVVRGTLAGVPVVSLQYCMLWPINYGYRCCCCWLGWHDADWEQCRVLVHAGGGDVIGVCFRAHASDQGQWASADECEFFDRGRLRPVVYVAPGSHGTYRTPGLKPRIFGVANDILARDIPWNAREARVEPFPEWCMHFRGHFGPQCTNPVWRNEFTTLGPTQHISALQRLFYPLSRRWIRHLDLAIALRLAREAPVSDRTPVAEGAASRGAGHARGRGAQEDAGELDGLVGSSSGGRVRKRP